MQRRVGGNPVRGPRFPWRNDSGLVHVVSVSRSYFYVKSFELEVSSRTGRVGAVRRAGRARVVTYIGGGETVPAEAWNVRTIPSAGPLG